MLFLAPRTSLRLVRAHSSLADVQPRIIFATSKAETHDLLPQYHPECGARIDAIETRLSETGYAGGSGGIVRLSDIVPASVEALAAVHSDKYLEAMQKMNQRDGPMFVNGADTYFQRGSYDAAARACGIGIALADRIAQAAPPGAARPGAAAPPPVGFCLARPPGHHAVPKEAMGFCLINTASVTARHCQRLGFQRVAIFDWDVHHGNGTQDAFYEDPDVLYISTHQKGGYPGTGKMDEVGKGAGEGTTLNLVLPGDSGDLAARATLEEVVAPAIERFKPDIIIISAGFDAHWRDPLAQLQYTTSTFHAMTRVMTRLAERVCQGRLLFVLEGGYDLKGLSESVSDCFAAVLGQPSADKFNPALLRREPSDKVKQVIAEAKRIHGL